MRRINLVINVHFDKSWNYKGRSYSHFLTHTNIRLILWFYDSNYRHSNFSKIWSSSRNPNLWNCSKSATIPVSTNMKIIVFRSPVLFIGPVVLFETYPWHDINQWFCILLGFFFVSHRISNKQIIYFQFDF